MNDNEKKLFGSGFETSGSGKIFDVQDKILTRYNGTAQTLRVPGFIFGIYNWAFAHNENLRKVSLSSNVTVIGEGAFNGCSELEEVELPYALKVIGKHAFNRCKKLATVIFHGTKEHWFSVERTEGCFDNTPDFTIFCNDGSVSKQEEIKLQEEDRIKAKEETEQQFKLDESVTEQENRFVEERRAYLENRRRELIARMEREMEENNDDEESEEDDKIQVEDRLKANTDKFFEAIEEVEDDENYDDIEDIRYKALKFCMKKGYASVSLIQRRFPIGYNSACKTIDWMLEEGFIISNGKGAGYAILITREKFNSLINTNKPDQPKEIPTFKKLLEKFTNNKKDTVKKLVNVLSRISEMKQSEGFVNEEPTHSLWNNEEEFDSAVMVRLERLVRSDLKMARRGAIKKAETYLYAVHDTHDGRMAQVYERIVYELKITSDSLYNQIRKHIREE